MKIRIPAVMLCLFTVCFLLTGCGWFAGDTAELLSPPELSGDASPIAKAITAGAGSEYTLKYPSRGDHRSAVIQNDIDSDGVAEAFAFYAVTEDDETVMCIDLIGKDGKEWRSVSRQKIVAGGVDQVQFCDLDNDGNLEILVGWEIYGASEMQLAVYSVEDGILIQRMLQQYAQFVCCDLNEDGTQELLLMKFSTAEQINTASLYSLNENGVAEISSCELDKTVKTVGEPVVANLSSGKTAVYIDEIKGVGAVTEVLFMEKNRLVNPLFSQETGETLATLRSAAYAVQDINGDGVLEIPVQRDVPSAVRSDTAEKLYLTDWCSFNGEALTVQMTTMINTADGYYYNLSQKLTGQIAVLRDTDRRLREIYSYDAATDTVGELLIAFRAVDRAGYEAGKYRDAGYELLLQDGATVFLCRLSQKALDSGTTWEDVKSNFKIWE